MLDSRYAGRCSASISARFCASNCSPMPVTAVVVVRRDEAQVVVRLVVRVRGLELQQRLEHRRRARAEELARAGPGCCASASSVSSGTFGGVHTATDSALLGRPREAVRQRALDEQRPPAPELRRALLVVGERPTPHGIVVKRERDRVDDSVEVGRGRRRGRSRRTPRQATRADRRPVLERPGLACADMPDIAVPFFTAVPATPPPWPGIVVVMEGNGISPQLLRVCERLAHEGYATVAPDLYWRSGGSDPAKAMEHMRRAATRRRPRRHRRMRSAGCARSARPRSASPASAWAADTRTSPRSPARRRGSAVLRRRHRPRSRHRAVPAARVLRRARRVDPPRPTSRPSKQHHPGDVIVYEDARTRLHARRLRQLSRGRRHRRVDAHARVLRATPTGAMMETRTLGKTGIQVSVQCLGAMMFGLWGNRDHDDSIADHPPRARQRHQLHRHRRRVLAGRVGRDRRQGTEGTTRRSRARDQSPRADG